MMTLFCELADFVIFLVTKPFSLLKLFCFICVKSMSLVILTCIELLGDAIHFHLNMFSRLTIWTLALVCLPVQLLTAFQRARLLEMQLHEMQTESENLHWDRKDLEERLEIAIRECQMMEVMLAELEEEHEDAIVKIGLLEVELQDVKDENYRLREIQGKTNWSPRGEGSGQNTQDADKYNIGSRIPSSGYSYSGSGITLQDVLIHNDALDDESKTKLLDLIKEGTKASGTVYATPGILSKPSRVNEVLDQQRDVALSQSLFSSMLALLVGMIIWEAEEPCIPLVVALVTVVGISLKSVLEFFFIIENKPASDAVALLSFNCFVLGTLVHPMLPIIAHLFALPAFSVMEQTRRWLGFSF